MNEQEANQINKDQPEPKSDEIEVTFFLIKKKFTSKK